MKAPDGWEAKRAFDLVVSCGLTTILAPIMLCLGIAVRLDSCGPALFRQERVGIAGRPFRIHKFRTMRLGHDGALVSGTGDARVTRLGRILRRTKLDELPQLIDVMRGDMSLVGPRPELPAFVALWPAERRELILTVRPGITDPASIELRNEADALARAEDPHRFYVDSLLPQKTAMYVAYVESRTFAGDLRILGRTLGAVLGR